MNLTMMAIVVAAGVGFAAIPASAAPATSDGSFKWTLDCTVVSGNLAGSAEWVWLDNGTAIPGSEGSANCASDITYSGTGMRPSNATGFSANLTLWAPFVGYDDDAGTKTFSLGKAFKIQLATAVNSNGRSSCYFGGCPVNVKASFVFEG